MEAGVNIGCSKEAVGVARQAILNIMECKADQETIRVALGCLKEACSIGNVSFSDCNISVGMPAEGKKAEAGKTSHNSQSPKRGR